MEFATEESLDDFILRVENFCNQEPVTIVAQVPGLEDSQNSQFPFIMKKKYFNSPISDKLECSKCAVMKKRLEERIRQLEEKLTFQQDQLFESYSQLSFRLKEVENKMKIV